MPLSNSDWHEIGRRIDERLSEASVPESASMYLIDRDLRDLIQDTNRQVNVGFRAADTAFRDLMQRLDDVVATGGFSGWW